VPGHDRRRPADEDRRRRRPQNSSRHGDRHLRRAWGRPGVDQVLSHARAELRQLLAISCAGSEARGGPGGDGDERKRPVGERTMAVLIPQTHLEFGSRFLQQLLRRSEENVFVSPASLGLALGMAAAGASGETLAAIEHTLGVDATVATKRAKRLFASFDTLPPGVAIEIANSLWAASGLPLSPRYAAAMRESYRAEVRNVDFGRPETITVINDWVARVTHGQIRSAIDQID